MNESRSRVVPPVFAIFAVVAILSAAAEAQVIKQKPLGPAIAIPTPTLTALRVLNAANNQQITGNTLPGPTVRIEFRGENNEWLTSNDVAYFRLSENSNFAGASWKLLAAEAGSRPQFTVSSGTGNKTIYAQVRNDVQTASGRTLQRVSATRAVTKHWTDPVQEAQATLTRLGCLHEMGYQNGIVVSVRCPLAEIGTRLQGLNSVRLNLEQLAPTLIRSRIDLTGTVEGAVIAESHTLDAVTVAGIVRVAATAIRTQSTSVSVNQNTLRIRFNFESNGTEFKLALLQPVTGSCDPCLPDLHWDNAGLTVNLTFGGSPTQLAITNVSVSNLGGSWRLEGNPGDAADAVLRSVGIDGVTTLRNQVSQALSNMMQSEINAMISQQQGVFREALIAPLSAGFSAPGGTLTIGYQTFNSSIVAEYRP